MGAKKVSGAKKVKVTTKAVSRKVFTLRLSEVERGLLDDVAKHRGVSISELIRQLIAEAGDDDSHTTLMLAVQRIREGAHRS